MTNPGHFAAFAALDPHGWQPFEVGQVQWLRQPGDGGRDQLVAGFARVSPADAPEPIEMVVHADETLFILEGHLRIEVIGGETLDLTSGTTASFNAGTQTRWTVLEPTVEFFVYS